MKTTETTIRLSPAQVREIIAAWVEQVHNVECRPEWVDLLPRPSGTDPEVAAIATTAHRAAAERKRQQAEDRRRLDEALPKMRALAATDPSLTEALEVLEAWDKRLPPADIEAAAFMRAELSLGGNRNPCACVRGEGI